jgi:hypothetical protein
MADVPILDISALPAYFHAAAGDVALPLAETVEELRQTHVAMVKLGKTVPEYLEVVVEIVQRRAGVELTRDEALTVERFLFAFSAKEAQDRTSLLRRWAQAETAQAEALEEFAAAKRRLEAALALHDGGAVREVLQTLEDIQARLQRLARGEL